MRRHDKTVAMLKANMLFEQRCNKKLNEELDNLDEGLKDKIKELFSGVSDKIKEKLSNIFSSKGESIANIDTKGIDKAMDEIEGVAGELQKNGIYLGNGVSGNWNAIKELAREQETSIKEGAINEDLKDKLSNVLMGIGFGSAITGGSVLLYAKKTLNWWDKAVGVAKNFLGGDFNTNIEFAGLKITQWYWVIAIGCAVGIAAALYKYNRSGKYKKEREAKAKGNTSMRAI